MKRLEEEVVRDPNRIPQILKLIEELWSNSPDLRLGQLLSKFGQDVFYLEDDNLLQLLKEELNE